MCRLYGFVASEETGRECSLVNAQNALLVQSDRDLRGVRNPDGWGIAAWDGAVPGTVKSTFPAFADRGFAEVAASVLSRYVIAHIRAATVGPVAFENTRPFQYGPWAFAHNGSIPSSMSGHISIWGPSDRPRGRLSPRRRTGVGPDLAQGRGNRDARSQLHPERWRKPGGLRWGNSLHWTYRTGVIDCMVCGSSHCPTADETYRAVVVASEPDHRRGLDEIAEGTVFGASSEITTLSRSLVGPTPASV